LKFGEREIFLELAPLYLGKIPHNFGSAYVITQKSIRRIVQQSNLSIRVVPIQFVDVLCYQNNPSYDIMTSRQQQTSAARRTHHTRPDRSENTFKGPQLLAPNIEELKHYILTTGLSTTSNGIVYSPFEGR
jgi:hypothetical protein